ncbi:hypothetical protein BSKO_05340 [Bryopsis sp. KO-2023]|nr:hypothetical protein BSKO_05340 [Bryopsis sp. KO-2023]
MNLLHAKQSSAAVTSVASLKQVLHSLILEKSCRSVQSRQYTLFSSDLNGVSMQLLQMPTKDSSKVAQMGQISTARSVVEAADKQELQEYGRSPLAHSGHPSAFAPSSVVPVKQLRQAHGSSDSEHTTQVLSLSASEISVVIKHDLQASEAGPLGGQSSIVPAATDETKRKPTAVAIPIFIPAIVEMVANS